MYKELFESNKVLSDIISNVDSLDNDKINNLTKYLEWQKKQHDFYIMESLQLDIPQKIFKNSISEFEYNKHKGILKNYYYESDKSYIKKNISINDSDSFYLLNNMVLISGKVVWIEFGFNIGREFGGRHPGVILKNIGEVLLVAPVTSGIADPDKKRQIDLARIYDFPKRERYTDISRITPVSTYRVDLNGTIGRIHKDSLNNIKSAIINYW